MIPHKYEINEQVYWPKENILGKIINVDVYDFGRKIQYTVEIIFKKETRYCYIDEEDLASVPKYCEGNIVFVNGIHERDLHSIDQKAFNSVTNKWEYFVVNNKYNSAVYWVSEENLDTFNSIKHVHIEVGISIEDNKLEEEHNKMEILKDKIIFK